MVGIICPLDVIGLTELPNSGRAKAHPAHPLAAALKLVYKSVNELDRLSTLCTGDENANSKYFSAQYGLVLMVETNAWVN